MSIVKNTLSHASLLLLATGLAGCGNSTSHHQDKPKPNNVSTGYNFSYVPPAAIATDEYKSPQRPASADYSHTGFPSQEKYIDGWIQQAETGNPVIRAHGWNVWGALTSLSDVPIKNGEGYLPNYMTWYSSFEIYGVNTPRDYQCSNTQKPTTDKHNIGRCLDATLLDFNKFSLPETKYVINQDYNEYKTLGNRPKTPLDMPPFNQSGFNKNTHDNVSFALKPVYYLLKKDAHNLLPYWGGLQAGTSSNMTKPVPTTWEQCVLITVGSPKGTPPTVCNPGKGNANVPQPAKGWEKASLDQFMAIPLTSEMVEALAYAKVRNNDIQAPSIVSLGDSDAPQPEVGDVAVLVGMHVTVRESKEWTWQTYYWSPRDTRVTMNTGVPVFPPNSDSFQAGPNYPGSSYDNPFIGISKNTPDKVPAWAQYYAMCTAYSQVYPAQPATGGTNTGTYPQICYNPWLETDFVGMPGHFSQSGLNSNCMTCHGQASLLGAFSNKSVTCNLPQGFGYYVNGYIPRDNTCLTNQNYAFDFSWHLANAYRAPEDKAEVNKAVIHQKPPVFAPSFSK